tara:strand:+ start:20 stop:517 length:498 start_codon:yes stop_codon:yes gene_type:complete
MTDSELQKKSKNELAKDFRSTVTSLEKGLKDIADGVNVIMGTDDKPILRDSSAIPICHHFMDGVYIRGMKMFKDQVVIGHIHKHLHMCFLLSGEVTVADEFGNNHYVAPCIIESTPGVKRVLYAHEESMWYNVHKNPTNIEDLDKLERDIVAISYEEYEEYIKNK